MPTLHGESCKTQNRIATHQQSTPAKVVCPSDCHIDLFFKLLQIKCSLLSQDFLIHLQMLTLFSPLPLCLWLSCMKLKCAVINSPVHTRLSTRIWLHTLQSRFESTSRGGLNPDSYATGSELKSSCECGYSRISPYSTLPSYLISGLASILLASTPGPLTFASSWRAWFATTTWHRLDIDTT